MSYNAVVRILCSSPLITEPREGMLGLALSWVLAGIPYIIDNFFENIPVALVHDVAT